MHAKYEKIVQYLAVTIVLLVLGGCANQQAYFDETNMADQVSAYQLVPRTDFEVLDLVSLLDPGRIGPLRVTDQQVAEIRKYRDNDPTLQGKAIDIALQAYHEKSDSDSSKRRDELQERILAASVQRCNAFKGRLQRDFSRTNFWLGVGTTVSAAAGAISGSLAGSKAFSGISAAFGGTRAEYDQSFYSNLTVNVIVDGIDARQKDIYQDIVSARRGLSVELYPVEAAIKDALIFHGACSIVTGLQYASTAIKTSMDPGIDAATRVMMKYQNLRYAADNRLDQVDLQLQGKLASLAFQGNTLVSAQLNQPDNWVDPARKANVGVGQVDKMRSEYASKVASLKAKSGTLDPKQQKALADAINGALDRFYKPKDATTPVYACYLKSGDVGLAVSRAQGQLDVSDSDQERAQARLTLQNAKAVASNVVSELAYQMALLESGLSSAWSAIGDPSSVVAKQITDATSAVIKLKPADSQFCK